MNDSSHLVLRLSVLAQENHDKGVTVKLSDGTTEEADLLVGADGIWSAVRAQMYNEGGVKERSKDSPRVFRAFFYLEVLGL